MKNIHILPTDKPSRLYKLLGKELKSTTKYFEQKELSCINQNIYITNDEEIKEGDWVFNFEYIYIVQYDSKKHDSKFWYKKIILTTDQDLIKDGVQAIDDEFLEWFVKNPSCEYVKVENIPNNSWGFGEDEPMNLGYKIIIPKEEPKFIKVNIESATGEDLGKVSYIPLPNVDYIPKQERMYSEEDMIRFAEFIATYPDKNKNVNGEILHAKSKYDGAERTIDLLQIWFEQFKKK